VRKSLLSSFDEDICANEPLHTCCNTCHKQCKCQGDECNVPLFNFDVPSSGEDVQIPAVRCISEADKECLTNALEELRVTLGLQTPMAVLSCYNSYLFGLDADTIQTIVNNATNISGIADLRKYCPFSSTKLLIMILEVMSEIFDDIEITEDAHATSLFEAEFFTSKLMENLNTNMSFDDDSSQCSLDEFFHLSDEWL
jgi:hypothetical protein